MDGGRERQRTFGPPFEHSCVVMIGRWGGLAHRMSELSHVFFLIITSMYIRVIVHTIRETYSIRMCIHRRRSRGISPHIGSSHAYCIGISCHVFRGMCAVGSGFSHHSSRGFHRRGARAPSRRRRIVRRDARFACEPAVVCRHVAVFDIERRARRTREPRGWHARGARVWASIVERWGAPNARARDDARRCDRARCGVRSIWFVRRIRRWA